MFHNTQQATLYDDTNTFRNVGQRTLQALYVYIGPLLRLGGRMDEHMGCTLAKMNFTKWSGL